MQTSEFILAQYALYPALDLGDMLKALHQSEFGCGHFVGDRAEQYLDDELGCLHPTQGDAVESLCGEFDRVHLRALEQTGLSRETLLRLFTLSGSREYGSAEGIEEKLAVLLALTRQGKLPFSAEEVECAVDEWRKAGFPLRRHTERFRENYHPAYRVIHKKYTKWLRFFAAIDTLIAQRSRVLVAIEGGSASGKSTLGDILSEVYDCNVFHMDDFFLRPGQRTPERFDEPGGNVDYERFLVEVLSPLAKGESVAYRRYDCMTQTVQPAEVIEPKKLNIIEGAYSLHPALRDSYDLRVFLNIDGEAQRKRIEKRNPPFLQKRFFKEWIPLENTYFEMTRPQEKCDLIFEIR